MESSTRQLLALLSLPLLPELANLIKQFLSLCPCSESKFVLQWVPIKTKRRGCHCRTCRINFCSFVCFQQHDVLCTCQQDKTCPETVCELWGERICCQCGTECSTCDGNFHETCMAKQKPRLDTLCESYSDLFACGY